MSAPEIPKLIERIQACELSDLHEHAAIRDELFGLRDLLVRHSFLDLAGCVDAAVTLTHHLPQVSLKAGQEIRGIVCRLVGVVGASLPALRQPEPPAAVPARRLRVTEEDGVEGLRLINDMLVGEILIQLGVVDQEKVDAAIKAQKTTGMRFGEALVHMGAASSKDVESALRLQEHLSQSRMQQAVDAEADERPPISAFGSEHLNVLNDMMLGEEMIGMGVITREQLKRALNVQNASGVRIGEALVRIGAATWSRVAEGVQRQARHRERGGGQERQPAAG